MKNTQITEFFIWKYSFLLASITKFRIFYFVVFYVWKKIITTFLSWNLHSWSSSKKLFIVQSSFIQRKTLWFTPLWTASLLQLGQFIYYIPLTCLLLRWSRSSLLVSNSSPHSVHFAGFISFVSLLPVYNLMPVVHYGIFSFRHRFHMVFPSIFPKIRHSFF